MCSTKIFHVTLATKKNNTCLYKTFTVVELHAPFYSTVDTGVHANFNATFAYPRMRVNTAVSVINGIKINNKHVCKQQQIASGNIIFLVKLYHYNRLMVTHIGMKLSKHTYYVTPMTHKWFPWQQPTTNSLGQFSLNSFLHFSNLPTMVHMEMKLCAHVYFIVSMTTINKKCPQALFPITTSSLLKLANHTMHGAETW